MDGTRKATIAAMALGLAACSGTTEPGGPLRVTGVTPATLATNVRISDTIAITFSKALLPSSVNDTTIVLSRDGLRVVGSRVLSDDGRTVSIFARLGNDQFYVLEVRAGVRDEAGNALGDSYVTAFSTALADKVSADDPTADTYNGSSFPDITRMTATPIRDTVVIRLEFAGTVSPSTSGLPNALGGMIDLDLDQDPQTGSMALTDAFGPPGTNTGLGIEAYVYLFLDQQGNATVVDLARNRVGLVPAVFGDRSLTLRIPLAMLGDDGNMNIAAVVGTMQVPVDVVPNAGHMALGAPGEVGASRAARALRSVPAVRAAPLPAWGR